MQILELENKLNHALKRIEDLETALVQTAVTVKSFERFTANGYKSVTKNEIAQMIELSRRKYDPD